MALSLSIFKKKPEAAPAAKAASSGGGKGVQPPAQDAQRLDLLQARADASAQVAGTRRMSEAVQPVEEEKDAASMGFEVVEEEARDRDKEAAAADEGPTTFHEQSVAGGAALVGGFLKDKSLENLILSDIQHASQFVYAARDFYEKGGDWKSGAALLADITNAFLAIESNVGLIPGFSQAIPFIGGVVSGMKHMVNTARVMESMSTLTELMDKVVLSEEDKAVLRAYQKEQKIAEVKHITMSVLGFARFAAEFFGAGTFVAVAEGIVSGLFTIRDFWIKSEEAVYEKAKRRLELEEMDEEDQEGMGEVNDMLDAEFALSLEGGMPLDYDNFSLMKLVRVHNELGVAQKLQKEAADSGGNVEEAREQVASLQQSLADGIQMYNQEMSVATSSFPDFSFKPIGPAQIEKLHELHVTVMHQILSEAKARQEDIEQSSWRITRFMKGIGAGNKASILKAVYSGKVPNKVDIRIGELSAENQQYFFQKTVTALYDGRMVAQMSKKTLITRMRKILLTNRTAILESNAGKDGPFSSEETFTEDMNRILNTLTL